jgi:hypothetical protein
MSVLVREGAFINRPGTALITERDRWIWPDRDAGGRANRAALFLGRRGLPGIVRGLVVMLQQAYIG